MQKPALQRLYSYQVFPGKNRFFCGGRIMSGPDPRAVLITFLLIVVPSGLFLAFP